MRFYGLLGFEEQYRFPPEDEDAGYVSMRGGDGVRIFSDPQDMPWGERLSYVADPDGNPVALAQAAS